MHQERIEILNVYAPKNRVTTYVKPKLIELKGENRQIIIGGFSTLLSTDD